MDEEKLEQLSGNLTSFDATRQSLLDDLLQCLDKRFGSDDELLAASKIANLKFWPQCLKDDPGNLNELNFPPLLYHFSQLVGTSFYYMIH